MGASSAIGGWSCHTGNSVRAGAVSTALGRC